MPAWKGEWLSDAAYAERVEPALATLRTSREARAVNIARATLESAVASQKVLREGAYHLLPLLLELLDAGGALATAAVYDVVIEIALAEPEDSTRQVAGLPLKDACDTYLDQARRRAWTDLDHADEEVAASAVDFLGLTEPDEQSFADRLLPRVPALPLKAREKAEGWLADIGRSTT
ncbi:hypothetical protein ABZ816_24220 [Actinosynnema sp. NPDC047251]|uniref:Uncharacterized protein n=1 Tax=Saccharothrix espanaensis (strain ATCC 51144 / DSM 44229 / JCM 9112 / NBRC 15066 / NRRL 15764) TaxID=1179773 RepID=K0K483_SACES|nr:hypothetical protein [Saccharothrix espanaensis]CCH32417.1 hypothetical protein BN6_51510 [Saccharothrix espanaensis DSM 44229]